jgi:hypothetical protein
MDSSIIFFISSLVLRPSSKSISTLFVILLPTSFNLSSASTVTLTPLTLMSLSETTTIPAAVFNSISALSSHSINFFSDYYFDFLTSKNLLMQIKKATSADVA